jgi:predicted nucleic acid-binding protein
MTAVIDASIVIAMLSKDDAHHRRASAAVKQARDIGPAVLPASAYAEVRVGAERNGSAALAAVDTFVREVSPLVAIDRDVAEHTARLRARHRALRLPDPLVIGAAHSLDAGTVLTTDAAWPRFSPLVKVVT